MQQAAHAAVAQARWQATREYLLVVWLLGTVV
jgi:hypothetical protein